MLDSIPRAIKKVISDLGLLVVYAGHPGLFHQLQLTSHNLATFLQEKGQKMKLQVP